MVQLCPGKAGFELASRHNDGPDLRLPQTCFVVIGLEERARAAARHLSSCKIEGAQTRLEAKRRAAERGELCRFCGRGQRLFSQGFGLIRQADAALPKAILRRASGTQQKSD